MKRTRELVWLAIAVAVVALNALIARNALGAEDLGGSGLPDPPTVGKIHLGMSPVDVRRVMGPPTRIQDPHVQRIDGIIWGYEKKELAVLIANGRVEAILSKASPRYKGTDLSNQAAMTAAGLRAHDMRTGIQFRRYYGPGFMVYTLDKPSSGWEATIVSRRRIVAIDSYIETGRL